jgi:hypothetical protein
LVRRRAAHRISTNQRSGYVVDPDPANAGKVTAWARAYWQAIHPFAAGGAYENMLMEEGQDRIRAAYRDNYERLAAIKAAYDAENPFHVNQNITPIPRTAAG